MLGEEEELCGVPVEIVDLCENLSAPAASTDLSYGYDCNVRCVFAFDMATSVRNVSELDLRSELFFMASTLAPMSEKTGSGLMLLAMLLPESDRNVLLHV